MVSYRKSAVKVEIRCESASAWISSGTDERPIPAEFHARSALFKPRLVVVPHLS